MTFIYVTVSFVVCIIIEKNLFHLHQLLESYIYAHDGVCEFLNSLKEIDASIQNLYLTSQPLSYAPSTRWFLQGLQQDVQHALPQGHFLCIQ
jgi:hypothetical protein